jgi:uncharacterized protein involved in exopolysaccharide biosynthesis
VSRTPVPTPPSDEISLRDLYLVVRRSALWIALVAIAAAAVVAAVLYVRPPSYLAEATTSVARAPISVQQEAGLAFTPQLDVPFDSYQTLAYSRGVLERVAAAVPEADLQLSALAEVLTLERLAGSASQPSSLLAVAHRARSRDPEIAARLANSWAETTIQTVRALLNENLDAVERITSEGLLQAEAAMTAVETELAALREREAVAADPMRLRALQERLLELERRRDELDRLIGAREAEARSLGSREGAEDDDRVVLTDAPEVALTLTGARWALEARLESLRAERASIVTQVQALEAQVAELSVAVVRYQSELSRLTRAFEQAQRTARNLATIEPTVEYVARLAPTGARMLSEAAVPTRAEPRRIAVVTLLTVIVAAFAGVVFVLLREAVRDPAAPDPARAASRAEAPTA